MAFDFRDFVPSATLIIFIFCEWTCCTARSSVEWETARKSAVVLVFDLRLSIFSRPRVVGRVELWVKNDNSLHFTTLHMDLLNFTALLWPFATYRHRKGRRRNVVSCVGWTSNALYAWKTVIKIICMLLIGHAVLTLICSLYSLWWCYHLSLFAVRKPSLSASSTLSSNVNPKRHIVRLKYVQAH